MTKRFVVLIVILICVFIKFTYYFNSYLIEKEKENSVQKYLITSKEILVARNLLIQIEEAKKDKKSFDICMLDVKKFLTNQKNSQLDLIAYCERKVLRYYSLPADPDEIKEIKRKASLPLPSSIVYIKEKDK